MCELKSVLVGDLGLESAEPRAEAARGLREATPSELMKIDGGMINLAQFTMAYLIYGPDWLIVGPHYLR